MVLQFLATFLVACVFFFATSWCLRKQNYTVSENLHSCGGTYKRQVS